MGKFDISLRDVIHEIPEKFIYILTGKKGTKFLDSSLPEVKERQADILLELEDNSIFHLEIQAIPDKNMPIRMLEYYLMIATAYPDREITQMVLYVGDKNHGMESRYNRKALTFSYELREIKDISCEELLESDNLTDKLIAVLCEVKDFKGYMGRMVDEILKLSERDRRDYIKKFLIFLDYRPKLKTELKNIMEEREMPLTVTEEMIKNDPFYQDGLKQGLERGLEQGLEQGIETAILNFYKNLGMDVEEIARGLELDKEFVEGVIRKKNLNID